MPPAAPPKNPGAQAGIDPQALKDLWKYNLTNHKPTADGIRRIEAMRSASIAMAEAVIDLCPPGRDQAMALSANEEMLFHANAAIARSMNEDVESAHEEDKASADDSAEGSENVGDTKPVQP